jgi:uncharacterized protein YecE (DUF72 family)
VTRSAPRLAPIGMARLYVGTSGWSYDWPSFYGDASVARRLEVYASRLPAVEINGTHYRLQRPETFRDWAARTPDDFRFVVKAHRYLTHNKKLIDPEEPISIDRDRARALGSKLGPILWQLPRNFRRDDVRLERWLRAIDRGWSDARHTLEPRHPSWMCDEVASRLEAFGVAACISDAPLWPLWERATSDFVYVRLHGHTRLYRSGYARSHLDRWARSIERWLAQGRDVHVYFDNTAEGRAPCDAERLLCAVGGAPARSRRPRAAR